MKYLFAAIYCGLVYRLYGRIHDCTWIDVMNIALLTCCGVWHAEAESEEKGKQ